MMVKLSDIFDLQMGKTPSRNNNTYWNDGEYDWISISDLGNYEKYVSSTKEKITELAIKETGIKKIPSNTLIMSFKLSVGKTAITKDEVYTNEAIMAFIPNNKYDVYTDYFYHLFSGKDWSKDTNRAVMGATLNKSTLGQIMIKIPPLEEQRKIAENLDKVSNLISKRKQQLEKLDLLVKSKFVEMFGDSKINSKKWLIKQLQDISSVGSSKRVFVDELQNSGIPFYRGTEIGALAENEKIKPELFITQEHYNALCEMSGFPKKGDLLMPSICPDGRIWLVNTDENFYFKDGRVLWVHSINEETNGYYLKYLLKEKFIMDYNSIASGTTFAELKIFALKNLYIMLPPIELQNQFADFVQQTEKTKTIINQSLEKLETLKKALMQKYFN